MQKIEVLEARQAKPGFLLEGSKGGKVMGELAQHKILLDIELTNRGRGCALEHSVELVF